MKYLSPKKAIQYLKDKHGIEHTPGTLAVWRSQGRGPRARKLSGKIYYTDQDLDHFVDTAEYLDTIDSRLEESDKENCHAENQ